MSSLTNLRTVIQLDLNESYLSNKKMMMFTLFIYVIEVLVIGGILGTIYHTMITTRIPENRNDVRNIFSYIQLTIFGYVFFLALMNNILGYSHPFFMSNKLTHLSSRIPFDSDILYLSAFGRNLVKILLLSLFYYAFYLPIHIIGHFSIFNVFLAILVIFIGSTQLVTLINLLFLVTKPIRMKFSTIERYGDQNQAVMITLLAPLVLSFFGLTESWYPSFVYMSHWVLFPIINTAIAFTGLFFRSGIPLVSIYGMISQFVIASICFVINFKLSQSYEYEDEIGKMMANYSITESKQQQFRSLTKIKVPLAENQFGGVFPPSNVLSSLLYKDYLALNRSRTGHRFFISSILSLPIVWYLLISFQDEQYQFWLFLLLIAVLISFIQIILSNETDLYQITSVSKYTIRVEKVVLFSIMNLIFLSPLFLINIWITLVFDFVIALILGWFHGSSLFSSLFGKMFISILYLIQFGVIIYSGSFTI